jgi:hypothetical protein
MWYRLKIRIQMLQKRLILWHRRRSKRAGSAGKGSSTSTGVGIANASSSER